MADRDIAKLTDELLAEVIRIRAAFLDDSIGDRDRFRERLADLDG